MPSVTHTDSNQPIYEPPEPFDTPAVRSYARQHKGTLFEQARAAIDHAQNEFQAHIKRTRADRDHYSPAGYAAQINRFTSTDAYKAIDQHVGDVRKRRDLAQAEVDYVRRSLSPDGDTAAELRATRFWNRTKGILDGQKDTTVAPVAQDLMAKATPSELGTLLQELGPYCTARGVNTAWIDATAAQVSPEYGRATRQLAVANQAVTYIEGISRLVQNSISRRNEHPVKLSALEPGEYDPDRT